MSRTLVVFLKEIRIMARDRRLLLSVTLTSLFVMPALMGLVGNMDRVTGADASGIEVVIPPGDPLLPRLLASETDLRLREAGSVGSSRVGRNHVTVTRDGRVYRVAADGSNRLLERKSRLIYNLLDGERERLFEAAIAATGQTRATLEPYVVERYDTAPPEQHSARGLAVLVPYMAIILLVSNASRASYVAVGEKEKNTLAALLVADTPRRALVLGKTFAIMAFTLWSSIMLVAGFALFARLGFTIETGSGRFRFGVGQLAELGVNLIALAFVISAVVMLIGTIARSQREASIWTAPLVFISIALSMVSFSSSEFSLLTYAAPVMGNALAMKETLLGTLVPGHLLLPLVADLGLAAGLVLLVVRLYERESVLFRE